MSGSMSGGRGCSRYGGGVRVFPAEGNSREYTQHGQIFGAGHRSRPVLMRMGLISYITVMRIWTPVG